MPGPGQQPTPEQIRMMQQQLAAEAQRRGISVQQLVEEMKAEAMRQHQAQQEGETKQTQEIPITGGAPPKPEALALATFLRSQDLKTRTCIFQEKRKDMFKGMFSDSVSGIGLTGTSQTCDSSSLL